MGCAVVLAATATVYGQDPGGAARPKIGLALSGGGARGAAHIGVLEWLEEHRVPVDYIAGTSMGGLVGALYAMGMTPADMRQLLGRLDWDDILRGTPAYDQLSFRRKEDRLAYPNAIELGWRKGLQLPRGINPGQGIGLVFDRVTLAYGDLASFDDLPIPFRCVATDMLAARPVVLKDGPLAHALRATMAFPGLFTPAEMNGTVLADGGLLNNLPTDVVKAMGADIVLAVDIGTPLGDRRALASLLGMLMQSVDVLTIQNVQHNLKLADIILWPDLGAYTFLDFKAAGAIADRGYKGAGEKAALLRRLALDETAWREHRAARRARQRAPAPAPSSLRVDGVGPAAARAIARRLEKHGHPPLRTDRLEKELTAITGWGLYNRLGYAVTREEGREVLRIGVEKKSHGPPFINLGMDVNSARVGRVDFNLRSRLTVFDVGGEGSEWRLDTSLGARYAFAAEYYRPLFGRRWFLAPQTFFERGTVDLFRNAARVAEYRVQQAGVGLDLGYGFGRRSEWRLGHRVGRVAASVQIGEPTLPNLEGPVSVTSLRWTFDGQNGAVVPTRGVRLRTEAGWFFDSPGAAGGFPQAQAGLSVFHSLGPRNVLFLLGGGGTTFHRGAPPTQQFTLGGPLRLGAYGQDEFRGSHFLYGGLGYLRPVSELPLLLGGKIYAGTWYEIGGAFNTPDPAKYLSSLSGGVVVETKLGALFLGGGWGESGRTRVYFAIGRLF